MIPEYARIAEIALYSCGFSDARDLAQKLSGISDRCEDIGDLLTILIVKRMV